MRNVKLCLLVVLSSVQTYNLVLGDQEICENQDKPLNKTNETEKTTKPNLVSRYNPYLDDRPKDPLLKNFNIDYFDPNRIKSKDDFFAMDSDEIGIPMVKAPTPIWQMENAPYGRGPQVLPDVVMSPEQPLRRKLIPEALGDDEKQMGRYLVEDTRRIIHVMQPNGEYKTYRPLPPSPEFSYPGYQPPLTAPPLYVPPIPHPHLPIYKTPLLHPFLPTAASSDEVSPENDSKSEEVTNLDKLAKSITNTAKLNDQKDATNVDSPYRVQLDLDDKVKAEATANIHLKPLGKSNHQDIIHPGLQIPITLHHPGIHPTDGDEKGAETSGDPASEVLKQLEELVKQEQPQQHASSIGSNPEKPEDPTSEILKQLGDLLKEEAPQQVTSPIGDEAPGISNPKASDDSNSEIFKQLEDLLKPEVSQQNTTLGAETGSLKPDDLNAAIMKQLEDLLTQELSLQNTSLVGSETGNLKPEKSDNPTDGILKQLEDLLRDGIGQQNASLVGSNLVDPKATENDPEKVISQTLNADNVPGKNHENGYTEIINAIMATDNIGDLVNNPLITADALKEIVQLLNIQQGNQDSIDPILATEQEAKLTATEKTHSKSSSLDNIKNNYTEVLSAIIETDRVEDLVNNPNITTDVLKEIADILESEQESLVPEGNPLASSQLENKSLPTKETKQMGLVGSVGLTPIGIETESGEVVPLNNSLPLGSNGKVSSGATKSPKKRSTNKIIRIPENLLEKPLLMISNENVLAAKLLNGTLERILSATTKNVH
nr:unnamed protein product [Callosobruchus analis]